MKDSSKTKKELLEEIAELRERVAALEEAGAVTCRDITRHKESEGRLRESEQRYRALVESSQGLICVHDLDGHLLSVNPAAARALGYEPRDGVGRSLADFLPDDVRPYFAEYLARIKRDGVDQGLMRVIGRTGEERLWAYRNVLHTEGDGAPYVLGHAADVTELKNAEEAARRSEANYRALVEHAIYGIYRSTPAGRFVSANPALVAMLGYRSEEELLGLDLSSDIYVDAADRSRLIAQYGSAERFEGVEVQWKRRDGTPLTVRLSGQAVRGADGQTECFEVMVEDVTEQRVLQAQLQQAQKMEAIGQLTGGIAHDFNNILTVIRANADLVDATLGDDQPQLRADLVELKAAARRGAEMVQKLLGFSRRGVLAAKPLDLGVIVEQLADTWRRVLPENIDVRIVLEPGLPRVLADPVSLEQILVNLATNARDAMPRGGMLRIEARRSWIDEDHQVRSGWGRPGEYVCLVVSDTGIGMDERVRQRVFEPFFTTKPPGEGTGLGMAMIYGLVKQQNGFVDVQSEVNQGTSVTVFFPATDEPGVARRRSLQMSQLPSGDETILLVEDEVSVRRAAKRVLERFGYGVLLAEDGACGLDILTVHADAIALVISDVVMPRMSGTELYEAARQRHPELKFLFMSGYTARDVRESTSLDTSVPFLHKPWTPTELLIRVREILDQRA